MPTRLTRRHFLQASAAASLAGTFSFAADKKKPPPHPGEEPRLGARPAGKHKRVTQMGTQIHAGDNYRRVVELVQSGAIGKVAEVHVWCQKSWGGGDRPRERPPVPPGLHWDLW